MTKVIKRGQVWRDGDKRVKGRTVTITRLLYETHWGRRVLVAEVRSSAGRSTAIRADRFDGRQFVLESEAPRG